VAEAANMALTDAQFDSIVQATIRMHAKGKTTNFHRRVEALRNQARAVTSSRPQATPSSSAPPALPKTPNAMG
jgi:hypothetical protein